METATQFQIRHMLFATTSIALAGAICSFSAGLGTCLIVLTSGFWAGVYIQILCNVVDNSEFEERATANQVVVAASQILIAACGAFGIILWALTALSIVEFVIS